MADKLVGLRYFADAEGRTNLAIADVGGSFLVVSQFTLYADVSRGRRPGSPGRRLRSWRCRWSIGSSRGCGAAACTVETGRFGAEMAVELVNDGPFTLVLDSERDLSAGGNSDARVV